LTQGVAVAMSLVAVALWLISDPLIDLLLGPGYADAAAVLRIYIWSTVFIALGMVQLQWLVNEGYEIFVLYRAVAGAAISLAATYALVPHYGPQGAAIAAVVAQFSSCVLINLVYDARTRELFIMQMKALLWLDIGRLLPKPRTSAGG
jgi:O-antigen/teichoic acid export membrane protein